MKDSAKRTRNAFALKNAISEQKISHHYWVEAEKDAFAMLIAAQPGEVVCITGPSRAGKTRLCHELRPMLVPDSVSAKGDSSQTGKMHTALLHAANTGTNGAFSTKGFVLHALDALQHPFYSLNGRDSLSEKTNGGLDRTPERKLMTALIETLRYREVQYLFVDELQHVRYAPGGERAAAAILDSLKCLAEQTQIVLVLVGAYPILHVLEQSPHIQGRKHQVHLRRYRETHDDLRRFNGILDMYTQVIPMQDGVSLRDWNELLYKGSLGCIGILEMWLRACVAYIDDELEPYLTIERLRQRQRPSPELETIAEEIIQGERYLMDEDLPDDVIDSAAPTRQTSSSVRKNRANARPFQSAPKIYLRNGRA